jgi:uncharacterized protein YegP (UPF0339 family)
VFDKQKTFVSNTPTMTNVKSQSVKWEFYTDAGGDFRWRAFHDTMGVQIGKSCEGFSSEVNAMMNAVYHGYMGQSHEGKDMGEILAKQAEREYQWEIYEDAAHNDSDMGDKGRWRWRFMRIMQDGTLVEEVVGASSEAYVSRESCVNNAEYFGYTGN